MTNSKKDADPTIVCAIYDLKADAYMSPNFHPTLGVAIRSFEATIQKGGSLLTDFPNDFHLVHLGYYDDNSGRFMNLEKPIRLGTAADFIKTQKNIQ